MHRVTRIRQPEWQRTALGRGSRAKRRCASKRSSRMGIRSSTCLKDLLGLVRLIPLPMDWTGLEKIVKKFDLLGI
jgi:hypothetical protein